ncbi:MAG: family 16 glycosylhydrolase [Propionibacteriales bacterium]|nr:family 16 glycosylhydrolase [Propionibacteriales bacterium]
MSARSVACAALVTVIVLGSASCGGERLDGADRSVPSPSVSEPSEPGAPATSPSGQPPTPDQPSPSVADVTPTERRNTTFNTSQVPRIKGWRSDFSDSFDRGPRRQDEWEAYGYGVQRPTGGAMGVYKTSNTTIKGGTLNLRYLYRDGGWTSAGVSSRPTFHAKGGRWEFRAKFPQGQGLGYAFLLWPYDDVGPTEVNIAEGTVNGPRVHGFYHYLASAGKYDKEQRTLRVVDLTQWHTFGVILEGRTVTYTFDGEPWATVQVERVTDTPLRIAFQTGALDPDGPGAQWLGEGVPGGVPGPTTPADATIKIDWVAHYVRR